MIPFFSKNWIVAKSWIHTVVFQAFPFSILKKKCLNDPICQVLCVDDDRSFCLFIQRLAYSLGIQLDVVYSIKEAKQVIESHAPYKALIIDGHLSDGSGFELVAWIREKKELSVPIGFISRIYQDAKSFRLLRESLKVDYVLEKPILPSQILQLLIQICQLPLQKSFQPISENFLSDLKLSYQKTIFDKIERLEEMILTVQEKPSLYHLQTLKGEVHKIAGSAGSYGYMAVSDLCKNLELEIIQQIELAKKGQFSQQWLFSLEDFFTQIKLHFQIEISETPDQISHSHLPSIYIVDEDQLFLNTFTLNQKQHFDLLTELQSEKAIQTLLSADFYPQIFLVNAFYSSSHLTGYNLIKAFYRENDYLTTVIALMVEEQSREQQVEALKKGMTFVLTKPLLLPWLLSLLDQVPSRALPLHYKILVVDDDLDICQYIVNVLNYLGLEVIILQDLQDVDKTLQKETPDLILLNVHLTHPSGLNILDYLRKDLNYTKSLVGMLTLTEHETYLIQKCYDADVDEILFKPLERGVLQRKISHLIKKQMVEQLNLTHDSLEGMENSQNFKRYINALQHHFQLPFPKILVIFEMEAFVSMNQNTQHEIVQTIDHHLEELLKKYEIAAYLGKGRFALVFQGYDPHFVQLFIHTFLLRIHALLKEKGMKDQDFHLNECLLILSAEEKIEETLRRSEQLLQFAQQKSTQSIRLVTDSSFVVSKEVLIFHDETQSLNSIKALFKEHAFKITSFSKIEEHVLQVSAPVPLLILMGSVVEAKGLCLLKKVFVQNRMQIPLLYLSHEPEKEYLQQLLTELNYFDAPFGLILLIHPSK